MRRSWPSVGGPNSRMFGRRWRHAISSLLAVMICGLLPSAAAPQQWNVAETGQPGQEVRLALSEGTWMGLDISPDGKRIVFELLGDIHIMSAQGGDAMLVHGGPAMQRAPRFSPDGRNLLFVSDAGGSDNIWISGVDGDDPRQISRETTQLLTGPAWSPDGRTIAAALLFDTIDKLHSSEIRLFDAASGADRLLIERPANGENVHEPAFSPDGRYLYYTEKVSPPSASVVYIDANHINYAVKRRDLKTGETEEVVKGFGSATTPALSPDGKQLAFVRRVKTKTVLFVYNIATREQRPVYGELDRDDQSDFIGQGNYYPQYGWFPDNRHVAIWAGGKLHRIDTATGAAAQIPFRAQATHKLIDPVRTTQDLAPERFSVRAIRQVAVAPNGNIVFNALGQLWQQPEKGAATRLTAAALPESEPAFAPNGDLAFVDWSDENGGSLKVRSRSGATRTLFRSPGVIREPIFSADGRRLLYKIDAGDRCMGGYQGRPGLYWISITGGPSHYIAPPAENPRFSPDGERVYFASAAYAGHDLISKIESVALDGSDRREHAKTASTDTSELRISPDLRWIAFRDRQKHYVRPMTAAEPPLIVSPEGATELGKGGGHELTWSADSESVFWLLGPTLYRHDVAAGRAAPAVHARLEVQAKGDRPDGMLAFVNGRIITMRGEEVIERGVVLIDGNRIARVGPAASVAIPREATVIDITGKTVMPGLIDMHGHIDTCYYSSAGLTPEKQAARYGDLAYGVTTNYDPYSSELPAFAMSEMTKAGLMVGPRAIDAGLVAYGRKGKGDAVYLPITSYADAAVMAERKRELGGTIVKSYRQPMRSQRQQLVSAGRAFGIMMDVEGESHFHNNLTMILDGHTNVQHNMPVPTLYDDVVQLMAKGKVAHTPTLIALFGELMGENYLYQHTRPWEDPKAQRFVQLTTSGYSPLGAPYGAPPYVRGMTTINVAEELWDIGFRSVARSMKKLDDAGVIVNAGSHGQIAGLGLHWEMWLMAQGGMANHRVLRTATINGAKTLGIDGQIGSIEPGKLADLIILERNPLEDIHNSNSVVYTLINGRLYDSLTMDEIGNRKRQRSRFYWEVSGGTNGIDWNPAWAHD